MRRVIFLATASLLLCYCQKQKQSIVVIPEHTRESDLSAIGKRKLSDFGFFKGPLKDLSPAPDVVPYEINAGLFSDYAYKKRFVKFPSEMKAQYSPDDTFDFPEGSVLIKNFYYPQDFRKPNENNRLVETRLLVKTNGRWEALAYVWNDDQTEAFLTIGGKNIDVTWTHGDGSLKQVNYSVPNLNQCKGCHLKGDKVMPIGPSARQLNKTVLYPEGGQNQLMHWQALKLLSGAPVENELPRLADYENENETIESRARAWLEVNCAHCHRSDGPAKNSGLHLLASVTDWSKLGVGKAPIAAGKGSGGLLYGIVPGFPDQSILQFRIESTDPGIMMPEVGRKVVHAEGVALVRQWIAGMKSLPN